ncbi:MAG: agmatine deiminase family protein [Gemmatimonadaceae bacterium]
MSETSERAGGSATEAGAMGSWRMPAEWERHEATWIAWPHYEPDWPGKIDAIPWVYAEIVRALCRGERVEILCHDETVRDVATVVLAAHDVNAGKYRFHIAPNDRGWLRDSAPTFVRTPRGSIELMNWRFNGWAKYDNHLRDEKVGEAIESITGLPRHAATWDGDWMVLEGGGIETDGAGSLMVTEEWLLSDVQVRNPGMSRADYEAAFARYLGITETIWLGTGCVGDDTHGHIDDIARFVPSGRVLLAFEENADDPNHPGSIDNLKRLEARGREVVRIPYPRPVIMEGQRLPASYLNFYVANDVVIVPTFNDRHDRFALELIAREFPDREAVGIHAVDLVWGLGTLHCLTQQQPAGRGNDSRLLTRHEDNAGGGG